MEERSYGSDENPRDCGAHDCCSGLDEGAAAVNTFALEHLGVPTRNYYLGWSDWGNTEETPVTTKEDERP